MAWSMSLLYALIIIPLEMIFNNYAKCEFFHSSVMSHFVCQISCLITDKLIIPQSWLTVATGHYFHLIAVTSQVDNQNLCFKLDGKKKFSLKFKSGRAAFLGRLWNGKSGEKFHYLCTPLLPPFWCAAESSLIIKPMNPYLSTPDLFVW